MVFVYLILLKDVAILQQRRHGPLARWFEIFSFLHTKIKIWVVQTSKEVHTDKDLLHAQKNPTPRKADSCDLYKLCRLLIYTGSCGETRMDWPLAYLERPRWAPVLYGHWQPQASWTKWPGSEPTLAIFAMAQADPAVVPVLEGWCGSACSRAILTIQTSPEKQETMQRTAAQSSLKIPSIHSLAWQILPNIAPITHMAMMAIIPQASNDEKSTAATKNSRPVASPPPLPLNNPS